MKIFHYNALGCPWCAQFKGVMRDLMRRMPAGEKPVEIDVDWHHRAESLDALSRGLYPTTVVCEEEEEELFGSRVRTVKPKVILHGGATPFLIKEYFDKLTEVTK